MYLDRESQKPWFGRQVIDKELASDERLNSEYYQLVGRIYDDKHAIGDLSTKVLFSIIRRLRVRCVANLKVLDCGCGTGRAALAYAALGAEVHAVDLSCSAIQCCDRKAKRSKLCVDARVASVYELPYETSMFDIVATSAALHHFWDLDCAIREMSRVLKPNGSIVATGEPKSCSLRPRWVRMRKETSSSEFDRKRGIQVETTGNPDQHVFSYKLLDTVFMRNGLQDVRYLSTDTVSSLYRDFLKFRVRSRTARLFLENVAWLIDWHFLRWLPDCLKALVHIRAIRQE